ncbi:Dynein light chain Tctex-type [Sparganum proliferum]
MKMRSLEQEIYLPDVSDSHSNYVGETGRLLRTRIAEHAAAVRRGDANSQVAAHSTGPGHIFKFQEAEILARGDNRVSRELLESWFSGPQSINKHNDLPVPYSVLRFSLGRRISHVGRTRASNHHGDSEPVCRAIVTPASSTDDEIAAINDSDSDRQATTASITTPAQAAAFSSIEAAAVLKDTVALCLGKHEFCPSKIEQWTSGIIDQCLIQLAKLNRPFKYIAPVIGIRIPTVAAQ